MLSAASARWRQQPPPPLLIERFGVQAHRVHGGGRRPGSGRAAWAMWWWRSMLSAARHGCVADLPAPRGAGLWPLHVSRPMRSLTGAAGTGLRTACSATPCPQRLGVETVLQSFRHGRAAPVIKAFSSVVIALSPQPPKASALAATSCPDALAVEMEGAAFRPGVSRLRRIRLPWCAPSPTGPTTPRTWTFRSFLREVACRYSGAVIEALFKH